MNKFEYKTIVLPFRVGIFTQGLPDIEKALAKEGQQGWQFKQMVLPSSSWGSSDSMVAILERTVEAGNQIEKSPPRLRVRGIGI